MSPERRSWVDAFDRVPVGYSPQRADVVAEPEPQAIPLAPHRRRARWRRALAVFRGIVDRLFGTTLSA